MTKLIAREKKVSYSIKENPPEQPARDDVKEYSPRRRGNVIRIPHIQPRAIQLHIATHTAQLSASASTPALRYRVPGFAQVVLVRRRS